MMMIMFQIQTALATISVKNNQTKMVMIKEMTSHRCSDQVTQIVIHHHQMRQSNKLYQQTKNSTMWSQGKTSKHFRSLTIQDQVMELTKKSKLFQLRN